MAVKELRGMPDNDELFMTTAALIGYLLLTFATFEFALNSIIAVTFKYLHGNRVEPEVPRQLTRARRFIRKAVHKIPELAPYRDELLEIEAEAKRLGDLRHDAAHGFVADYDAEQGVYTFAKAQPELEGKAFHELVLREISVMSFGRSLNEVTALGVRTTELLKRLIEAHVPQDAREQLFRAFRGKAVPGLITRYGSFPQSLRQHCPRRALNRGRPHISDTAILYIGVGPRASTWRVASNSTCYVKYTIAVNTYMLAIQKTTSPEEHPKGASHRAQQSAALKWATRTFWGPPFETALRASSG